MSNSKIIGVGSYAPSNVVTNFDLEKLVETTDEWITTRTGIKSRHISINEDTSDLSTKAALSALKESSLKAEELDYIIVATCSPDKFIPSTACIVQKNIGAKNAAAFDVSAACTGFIYALQLGDSLIKSEAAKNVLVIGAEVLSKIVNWEDRSTCVLFGDGAGAAILTKSEEKGILYSKVNSEGDKWEALVVDGLNVRNPFSDSQRGDSYIQMNGGEIFKFAVKAFEDIVNTILEKTSLTISDIDCIIPHQANYRIIETISKRLKIPMDKFYMNLKGFGNTSAASIPIALSEAVKYKKIKKGDKVLLIGFGGGLTWGGSLLQW
ncbi:MAG: beta-ketoacyl-ACP synthase III [Sarcina sp.]